MTRMMHGALVRAFSAHADTKVLFQTAAAGNDTNSRRPPVPERASRDLSGDDLAAYINGLERRMVVHMRKHAPMWHQRETRNILKRWNAPHASHPAPSWAAPRDTIRDARDYAATLLRDRLSAKMGRLSDIRIARYLGGHGQVDPLHLIFHDKSTVLDNKFKMKL